MDILLSKETTRILKDHEHVREGHYGHSYIDLSKITPYVVDVSWRQDRYKIIAYCTENFGEDIGIVSFLKKQARWTHSRYQVLYFNHEEDWFHIMMKYQ